MGASWTKLTNVLFGMCPVHFTGATQRPRKGHSPTWARQVAGPTLPESPLAWSMMCAGSFQVAAGPHHSRHGESLGSHISGRAWWEAVMATLRPPPKEADGKTDSSKLSPRWFLYTWFIPSDPHVATPASFTLPAWSHPPPPLLGGLLSRGYVSRGGVGRKGGALAQSGSPVASAPQRGERGGRRKAAQNWGSNTQEATE